jgi:hypothetical protein
MALSNTKKSRILYSIYACINGLDKSAVIKRDPLHARYAVNKYSIQVKVDKSTFKDFKANLTQKCISRHDLVVNNDYTNPYYVHKDENFSIFIDDMSQSDSKDLLLSISIH